MNPRNEYEGMDPRAYSDEYAKEASEENVAYDQPQTVDDVLSELAGVQKVIDRQQERKQQLIELYHKYQEVQSMKFAEIVDRPKFAEPVPGPRSY